MGRYHTNWLNMMYPRLRLAANLLRDDGVIFVSIDDGEQSNMRKLCDEVFGEENFMAQIIWQKVYSPRMDVQGFSTSHDYIFCYVKSNVESIRQEAFSQNIVQFNFTDPINGKKYRRRSVRKEGSASLRSDRPNSWFPLIAPDGLEVYPVKPDGTEGRWRWDINTYKEKEKQGLVEWVKTENGWQVYAKQYLDTNAAKPPETLWLHQEVGHNHSASEELKKVFNAKVFDSPKPKELIIKMLKLATYVDSGDIILDFFSGSATTAHAVMQLNAEDGGNRRFIMVQLPELCDEKSEAFKTDYSNICEIGKERIRRVGKKLLADGNENHSLDVGFKVFKLDTSNMKLWDDTPIVDSDIEIFLDRMAGHIQGLKADRSNMDFVYEIMLKLGYSLTATIDIAEIDGQVIYIVDDGKMFICLQPGITAEQVERMAAYAPQKIVLAENALADNSVMSNVYYLLDNQGIELKII